MASQKLIAARNEARKNIVPLTMNDVVNSDCNFHESYSPAKDGTCHNWRRNGKVQLWKTRPEDFRQPIKFGLRTYGQLYRFDLQRFHRADTCPVSEV